MKKRLIGNNWRIALFVLLGGIVAVAALQTMTELSVLASLQWQRVGIMSGDFWRMLSAHLVHLNLPHAAMNAAALVLILLLLGSAASAAIWCALWVGLSLIVSAALLAFDPHLDFYAGASGVLHGLVAFGALALLRERRVEAAMLLLGLMLKLFWEQLAGAPGGTAALIGAPVIVNAHLYGAIAGAVPGLFAYRFRQREAHQFMR